MSTGDVELLIDAIKNGVEKRLYDLHTAIPAEVVSYDTATNTCSVQPSIKRKLRDGSIVTLPQIQNVPICFPRSGNAIISLPISAGDPVLLIFSERSIDVWFEKGGIKEPLDARKHSLSDAFAILGGAPKSKASSDVSTTDVVIANNDAKIEILPSGKYKISKKGGEELMDLLSQLADACSQISNSSGPTFNAGTFVTLKNKIDTLKG